MTIDWSSIKPDDWRFAYRGVQSVMDETPSVQRTAQAGPCNKVDEQSALHYPAFQQQVGIPTSESRNGLGTAE